MPEPSIRPASPGDFDGVWSILEPVLASGESYALPSAWQREEALEYWFGSGHRVFVAEDSGAVAGTYYLRANQRGGGDHVANAGFVTHPRARGRGIARSMALHALATAREAGFSAMQFNFVVSTNTGAIALWDSLGFREVGRLPRAFQHPSLGLVDALVLHRDL